MSDYIERAQIEAIVPPAFLLEALDDDNDGEEDSGVYDALVSGAQDEVDGYFAPVVTVPFETVPPLAKVATKLFILESLYARRGYSKDTEPKNPWYSQAAGMRARLQRVSSGDERVSPTQAQVVPGVVLVSEPSRTQSSSNKVGF